MMENNQESIPPTREELKQIYSLTSRDFDLLFLQTPEKLRFRPLIAKGILYFEDQLRSALQRQSTSNNNSTTTTFNSTTDSNFKENERDDPTTTKGEDLDRKLPKDETNTVVVVEQQRNEAAQLPSMIYRRLGHLHLIAQDYPKAHSAYEQSYKLDSNNWTDADFMFGLGLVYFHFNEFACVIKVFQNLLYVYPNFKRSADANVRLGLSYKGMKNWESAIKNLNAALIEPMPLFSPHEIRFHIADCYDQDGQWKRAKELYEALLLSPDLPRDLRASILRHMGFLYFRTEELGEKAPRLQTAVARLQESLNLDPNHGKTHYFLGRCYSAIGRAHDAFVSYRQSIDKAESSADTWCSIGVLYQQQQQPMDALQAFVCAVQLDERHYAAWVDLGLLYEQCGQPSDALMCFNNATKGHTVVDALAVRIRFLEEQLKQQKQTTGTNTTTGGGSTTTATSNNSQTTSGGGSSTTNPTNPAATANGAATAAQKRPLPSLEEAWNLPIPAELTSRQDSNQKQKLLQYLRGSLLGIGVQDIYQHQRLLQEAPGGGQQQIVSSSYSNHLPQQTTAVATAGPGGPGDFPQVSQEDLQALLGDGDFKFDPTLGAGGVGGRSGGTTDRLQENDLASTSNITTTTASQNVSPEPPPLNLSARINVPLSTSAQQLETMCKARSTPSYQSPVDERTAPPKSEPIALPLPAPKESLIQVTPCIVMDNKRDTSSYNLQMFCYQTDVACLRNFASCLRLDLGLFSTKTLMETAGDQQVEVRTQHLMPPDKNYTLGGDKSWHCGSTRSFTTVTKYAQYQALSFQQSLREEKDHKKNDKSPEIAEESTSNHPTYKSISSSTTTSASAPNLQSNGSSPSSTSKRRRIGNSGSNGGNNGGSAFNGGSADESCNNGNGSFKMLKFGTNVDLSDDRRWKAQLHELQKLPPFCRVTSSQNLLSHLNHIVLGMNTVQLYMKVPGSRTPGHQENNNFASVNINIGPGECEWFAVAHQYWHLIREMCERNHVDYLKGSWWPPLEDLLDANIPVYRFTQKPGDLVWVGSGTVHWVQATGWCNNIAWNVGPFTAPQLDMAIERYEWNKLYKFKSIVPVIHLAWQLARNVKFSDEAMYERVKSIMLRSVVHCYHSIEYATSKLGKELRYQAREEGEPAHYCTVCENEVFNILYVMEQDRKFVVYCVDCALRMDPGLKQFTVLNQYSKEELTSIYEQFSLIEKKPGSIV